MSDSFMGHEDVFYQIFTQEFAHDQKGLCQGIGIACTYTQRKGPK